MKESILSVTKKDLDISYFSGTGAGGQHRNKHQNCVRLKHFDSGVMTTGQSNKERRSNLREAINNLAKHPKFKVWLEQRVKEMEGQKTLEETIKEQLLEKNLLVEYKDERGRWITYEEK